MYVVVIKISKIVHDLFVRAIRLIHYNEGHTRGVSRY